MSDHPSLEQLEDLAYRISEGAEAERLTVHLEGCEPCSRRHDRIAREKRAFEGVLAPRRVDLPPELRPAVPRGRALSLVAGGLVLCIAVTLLVRLHLADPAPAQDLDDPTRARISSLALDLDADDPSTRENAQEALRELVRDESQAAYLRKAAAAAGPEAVERAAKVAATYRYGRIVFEKNGRIWSANPDGSGPLALTEAATAAPTRPVCAPDGSRIAFETRVSKGPEQEGVEIRLEVMNLDGSGRRVLSTSEGDHGAVWSPDGRRLAFGMARARKKELLVADADGGVPVTLAKGLTMPHSLAWSPDGTRILFSDMGAHDWNDGLADLQIVELRSGRISTLSSTALRGALAAWSPDGATITYSGADEIREVRPDGSGSRLLIRGPGSSPVRSPDGRLLAFIRGEEGALYVAEPDRSDEPRRVGSNVWSFQWAWDGKAILVSSNFNVSVIDLSEGKGAAVWMISGGARNGAWGPRRDAR